MSRFRFLANAFVVACACLLLNDVGRAQSITICTDVTRVVSYVGLEPSAIEGCCDGKFYLIANDKDKKASLLLARSDTGELVNKELPIPGVTHSSGRELLPYDWEAMTGDRNGHYYLVGSYQDAPYNDSHYLLEFSLNTSESGVLSVSKVRSLTIKNRREELKTNRGLRDPQIEGLAFQQTGPQKKLIFGVRDDTSPTIFIFRANVGVSREIRLETFFAFKPEETAAPRPPTFVKWHLSSIEYVPGLGYLILTSTEAANKFYGNALWFLSEAALDAEKPAKDGFKYVSPTWSRLFGGDMKAEGLHLISTQDRTRIQAVIVFDNDGKPGQFWPVEINLGPKP